MELDFTGLSDLENQKAPEPKQQRSMPAAGTADLQRTADTVRSTIETAEGVLARYQNATMEAGSLRNDILKGVRSGEGIYSLFLKAVKVIALTTGNSLYYDQIEQDLLAIYGAGLHEQEPLQIEKEATQKRLEKLLEAEKTETQADTRERIQAAIRAHRKRIEELEKA